MRNYYLRLFFLVGLLFTSCGQNNTSANPAATTSNFSAHPLYQFRPQGFKLGIQFASPDFDSVFIIKGGTVGSTSYTALIDFDGDRIPEEVHFEQGGNGTGYSKMFVGKNHRVIFQSPETYQDGISIFDLNSDGETEVIVDATFAYKSMYIPLIFGIRNETFVEVSGDFPEFYREESQKPYRTKIESAAMRLFAGDLNDTALQQAIDSQEEPSWYLSPVGILRFLHDEYKYSHEMISDSMIQHLRMMTVP